MSVAQSQEVVSVHSAEAPCTEGERGADLLCKVVACFCQNVHCMLMKLGWEVYVRWTKDMPTVKAIHNYHDPEAATRGGQ